MARHNTDLCDLIFACLSGSGSDEQQGLLEQILLEDSEARKIYVDYMMTFTLFHRRSSEVIFGEEDRKFDLAKFFAANSEPEDSNISLRGVDADELELDVDAEGFDQSELTLAMYELLKMEQICPAVDIPEKDHQRELIQKVDSNFKLFSGKVNKPLLRAYIALAACIMLFVGYLHFFVPDHVDRPAVAKLVDSINAVWDSKLQVPEDFGVMVQSRYHLKEGYASILFNDGAFVTVDSPAELSLNSSGDMELFIGRIYADVPERAHGFTVKAGSSKVVDLGTEFGVEIDDRGNTQLHVMKGRTMLFARLLQGSEKQIEVLEGIAKKVYNDGFVKDIEISGTKFVRKIDSKSGLIVKSEIYANKVPFVAYHDLGATAGRESTGNITTHMIGVGELGYAPDNSAKELINYSDGSPTGVSIIIDHANGLDSREDAYTRPPDKGTPAYLLFNVSGLNLNNGMVRVGNKNADHPDNYTEMTLTLKGLHPEMLYDLALYGDRDRPVIYNAGVDRFNIGGVDSATNISSTGIIDNFTTEMETLQNANSGQVIRWTRISSGSDGTITVKVDAGFYGKVTNIAYLSAMRLEAVQADSGN